MVTTARGVLPPYSSTFWRFDFGGDPIAHSSVLAGGNVALRFYNSCGEFSCGWGSSVQYVVSTWSGFCGGPGRGTGVVEIQSHATPITYLVRLCAGHDGATPLGGACGVA